MQYGSWPTPPEFLREAPPGAASPAAAPPGLRESRLKILQVHLRQGMITQEEYEHLGEMELLHDVPGEHARGVRLYGRTPRELGILR
jgi:hypothetical protein